MTKQELYAQHYTDKYSLSDVQSDFNYCYKQLVAIFPEVEKNKYNLIFNYTALKRLGQCSYKGYNRYEIQLNYHFAQLCNTEAIRNTIMHELTHSLRGCMKHTGRWKSVTNRINYEYNYNISRISYYSDYHEFRLDAKPKTKKYRIQCQGCGKTFEYCKQSNIVKELMTNPQSTRFWCRTCKCHHFTLNIL